MSLWLILQGCIEANQIQSTWKLLILYLGKFFLQEIPLHKLNFGKECFKSTLSFALKSGSINRLVSFFCCSMFSLLFLHVFLYGCNIFAWRKARINYSFIFELTPTKELNYRDAFLICTTSMTVVVGVMFVHLSLLTKGYSYSQVQVIPGLLLLVICWIISLKLKNQRFWSLIFVNVKYLTYFLMLQVFLLLLVCPFNIVYRSSRYCFLRVIRNIVLSPLYKV